MKEQRKKRAIMVDQLFFPSSNKEIARKKLALSSQALCKKCLLELITGMQNDSGSIPDISGKAGKTFTGM